MTSHAFDALNAHLEQLGDEGVGRALLRHPRLVADVVRELRAVPKVIAPLGPAGEGRAIDRGLRRDSRAGRVLLQGLTAVLQIEAREPFTSGPSKTSLRQHDRWARREGVRWRPVPDPDERLRMIEVADARERHDPRERYRAAEPRNRDLAAIPMWMLAERPDGTPLLLAVIAVDREWALLRYFRTLADGRDATSARYMMMTEVVAALHREGVRYLATWSSPLTLEPGLRLFQRRLGFTLRRVHVARRAA